ncbi:MAG: hypothetical protein R3291_02530, partial [Thermoplasmata archaeon]|nr:hypothetical protein [Thermoplasmata archaeon]
GDLTAGSSYFFFFSFFFFCSLAPSAFSIFFIVRLSAAPISWVKVAGLAGIVVAAALGIAALFGLF